MKRRRSAGTIGLARTAIGVGLLAGVLTCCFAATAGAQIVVDKRTGVKFGIVRPPTPPRALLSASPALHKAGPAFSGTPTCDNANIDPNCATPLTYHGGPVQHAENVHLFFWDPSGFASESSYVTDLQTWLNDVAAGDYTTGHIASLVGNPVSVVQQYYDRSGPGHTKRFIPYDVSNAGTIMDTDPYPTQVNCQDKYTDWFNGNTPVTLGTCLTQGQLFTELSDYIAAHHLSTGINTEYFILTPPNVGSCADSTNKDCAVANFCAWHTFGPTASSEIIYAYQPWLEGTTCDVNRVNSLPNIYTSGIDSAVNTFSHELSESMTDPTIGAWYSSGVDEVGDKCGYQYQVGHKPYETFAGLPLTGGGAYYNALLGTDDYLLQEEFDDLHHGCNQWDTFAQPTATVTAPGTATTGAAATFSLSNVKTAGNIGVAYVKWNFGDNSTATSIGTAPISHYFQAPGSYTASAIVTDNHGSEVKETAPSSVTVAPPTTAQLQNAVNAALTPVGTGARIENLLANGGYAFTFHTYAAGVFQMVWKHGTTTVATVTSPTLTVLGPSKLKLTLTPQGRSLLANANTLKIAVSDSFTPSGGTALTGSLASFTLSR
jgi:hypothetical protein